MQGDQDVANLDTWRQLAGELAALPLLFNAPLSERHATRLIDDLHLHERSQILDLGCGWGERLLRALATMPGAIGVGVDHDLAAVSRARVAAAKRNLLQRVTFVCADLLTYTGPPADVVFAIGIGHTTPSPRHTLTIIRDRLLPGGSALYADGYWKCRPTAAEQVAIGSHSRELGSLGELCADAAAVGFDVLSSSVADDDELRSYARRTCAGLLQRLEARGADYEREVIEHQEALWRDVLQSLEGFAYLLLRQC